jgi:hypothetical protein
VKEVCVLDYVYFSLIRARHALPTIKDGVISWNNVMSNSRMIDEWQIMCGMLSWPNLKYCRDIWLEGLSNTKIVSGKMSRLRTEFTSQALNFTMQECHSLDHEEIYNTIRNKLIDEWRLKTMCRKTSNTTTYIFTWAWLRVSTCRSSLDHSYKTCEIK